MTTQNDGGPPVGRTVPQMIVPKHELTATIIVREADDWWARLTREERVGLWTRYRPLEES